MKYYPNGENGYSAFDDNWNEIDKVPAKDMTPVERITRRFPLGQAKMPSGASGAAIGTALGKAFSGGAGRNRGPDGGGDDQIIGAKTGEFVVNDKSARIFGYDNLEKINNLGKDGEAFSLSSGAINPTTYGPTSPGATPADKNEFIGAFDNRLRDKLSVGVNPRNPWGIRPGPGVRLNIDGRQYNVDDYTHPRVPANTVDFYHGYQDGGAVQPWWMQQRFNEEFRGRSGGYGIQPQSYLRGGEVGEGGGGGGGGTGDTHGFYDRTGTFRGYNPNYEPNPLAGNLGTMWSGQGRFGPWGMFNTANPWARPWLDKMYPGRGNPRGGGGYQEGGVVGESQSDTLPEPLAASFLASEGSGRRKEEGYFSEEERRHIDNEEINLQRERLAEARERRLDEQMHPSTYRENVTPVPNSNFVNDDIKSIEMRINGEHWEVPTRIPGWENFWGLGDTNIHPEDWPIDYQNAIEDRARQNIEQGRSPFEEPVDDVSELEPEGYAQGGRVRGRGMGRRPRGFRNAARRNAMMSAYEGPTVEIPTDQGGGYGDVSGSDLAYPPHSLFPRSSYNPGYFTPPGGQPGVFHPRPRTYNPTNPSGTSSEPGGDYVPGGPSLSGIGSLGNSSTFMGGNFGPYVQYDTSTGDYFIPFWGG